MHHCTYVGNRWEAFCRGHGVHHCISQGGSGDSSYEPASWNQSPSSVQGGRRSCGKSTSSSGCYHLATVTRTESPSTDSPKQAQLPDTFLQPSWTVSSAPCPVTLLMWTRSHEAEFTQLLSAVTLKRKKPHFALWHLRTLSLQDPCPNVSPNTLPFQDLRVALFGPKPSTLFLKLFCESHFTPNPSV